ncbi:hypothetical protein BJF93_16615 [Xaviernesmea oryzae]|uniref:CENP-V/GFA domain-containing protein n=1 Tax=Xaviernesmea oryzae TaxID=464029 RepID=A0A1Q9AT04_9HYPH|nr:GFA family protein [Xaviernesmea oryzae]OLP58491.1 hypothetical protein BJF93_16615 [Xaviernesmea oryzae]SEK59003.1 Uncharacterized conserved protein [Xaviernesmea oryzae]
MSEARDRAERSGKCLCGAVRFTLRADTGLHACHCATCRRWTGGAFMVLPCEAPVFADQAALKAYTSSDWAERLFCGECGSSLFWRMRDGRHWTVSAHALDDQTDVRFKAQVFIDEKPDFYAFANTTTMMTGAEVVAAFSGDQQPEHRDGSR